MVNAKQEQLEQIIQQGAKKTLNTLDNELTKTDIVKYLAEKHLPSLSTEKQKELYPQLVKKVEDSIVYSKGFLEKATEKLSYTNLVAIVRDVYGLARGIPAIYSTYIRAVFTGGKTLLETPGVVSHLYKTGKAKGAESLFGKLLYGTYYNALDLAFYGGTKLLGIAIPVVGPAIEAGAFKRLIERRVTRSVDSWLQKLKGIYKSPQEKAIALSNKIYDRIKQVAGPIKEQIEAPVYSRLQTVPNPIG